MINVKILSLFLVMFFLSNKAISGAGAWFDAIAPISMTTQQLCAASCSGMVWNRVYSVNPINNEMTCEATSTLASGQASYPVVIGHYTTQEEANMYCQKRISMIHWNNQYQVNPGNPNQMLCGCQAPPVGSCAEAKAAGVVSQCSSTGDCKTYGLTSNTGTWEAQQQSAQSYGANITTVSSKALNHFFQNGLAATEDVWIGMNDRRLQGAWIWINGSASSYTNWAPGEPNNLGGEHCAAMYNGNRPTSPGLWNDLNCDGGLKAIFEWD